MSTKIRIEKKGLILRIRRDILSDDELRKKYASVVLRTRTPVLKRRRK